MNPRLYPSDYLGVGDIAQSQTSALSNAVSLLNTQASSTAIQQSMSRLTLGQGVIANSNQFRTLSRSALMPLSSVGARNDIPPGFLGTLCYLAGGRAYNAVLNKSAAFFYSNESSTPEGFQLSEPRAYAGTTYNVSSGYWFTGWGYKEIKSIEKISYLQVTTRNTGQEVGQARAGAAGIGTAVRGVIVGGAPFPNVNSSHGGMDFYDYASEQAAVGGVTLTPVFAPHNGASQAGFGWIFGGSSKGLDVAGNATTQIQRVNITSLQVSAHSQSLPVFHLVHACAGNTEKAIIAGGLPSDNVGWFGTDISGMTFSTGFVTALGATLSEGTVCADGCGSSYAMYALGGDTIASATAGWIGGTKIERVVYATDTASLIGSELPNNMADQGAVGDYSGGLY